MLEKLGWNTHLETLWNTESNEQTITGRVSTQSHELFNVITEQGEWLCTLPGTFHYSPTFDYPAVGDWVMVEQRSGEEKGIIRNVFERTSVFMRKTAGLKAKGQVIAANIDYALLVMSCNEDFNVRRLERYLLAAWDSGATPIIVLTKSDLIDDETRSQLKWEAQEVAYGVPIHFVSNETGENIKDLHHTLYPNKTGALLGSSGVGKSTLVNSLLGIERMETTNIRQDDSKGKHTTTHRELIVLPAGGLLIDTPGMREFQLWRQEGNQGLTESFQDVEMLINECKFNDCQHDTEPGCAIKKALEDGRLSQDRYDSYVKLQKELAYVERKGNEKLMRQEKEKWKKIAKEQRKRK